MQELAERLRERRWFYPPYLGILGFLADAELEFEDEAEEVRKKEVELNSILPLSNVAPSLELDPAGTYIREEHVPLSVLPGRYFRYLDVAYIESTARPLLLTAKENEIRHFLLRNGNLAIIFLEQ